MGSRKPPSSRRESSVLWITEIKINKVNAHLLFQHWVVSGWLSPLPVSLKISPSSVRKDKYQSHKVQTKGHQGTYWVLPEECYLWHLATRATGSGTREKFGVDSQELSINIKGFLLTIEALIPVDKWHPTETEEGIPSTIQDMAGIEFARSSVGKWKRWSEDKPKECTL